MEEQKDISNTEFVITRHGHSCNNLKAGKSSFSVMDRAQEFDPGLSIYGILTTLLKTSKIDSLDTEDTRYKSSEVFVSPLIRTWLTSLLLYLPNLQKGKELDLHVSPYLIEKYTELNWIGRKGANLFHPKHESEIEQEINRHRHFWTGDDDHRPFTYEQSNSIEFENGMFNAGSTIDGGNLPSDVGQQIISLYHFFDVIRGINNSVIKQIEDKEYLKEFKENGGVNVLPDDNNVKLLYQSLQNMKKKYFNINVPNFATAGSEGNNAKDFKLHLYVNEKLELSLVDRDKDLPQYNGPKIIDYYYFKTNNKFPGLRNNPHATIREIIENYETLRRKEEEEEDEVWSINTETGIVTKTKKKEKKKWMVFGEKEIVDVKENILTQSKYEEMMQENMDTYIPRLLENIDTRNICDNMDTKSSYKILKNLCKFVCDLDSMTRP